MRIYRLRDIFALNPAEGFYIVSILYEVWGKGETNKLSADHYEKQQIDKDRHRAQAYYEDF